MNKLVIQANNTNKDFTFECIHPKFQKLLKYLRKEGYIQISYVSHTIRLTPWLFGNKNLKNYEAALKKIKNEIVDPVENEITHEIFSHLYNPDKNLVGIKTKPLTLEYMDLCFRDLLSNTNNTTTTKTTQNKTQKTGFFLDQRTDITDVSHPHVETPVDLWKRVGELIKKKIWGYAIYIAKFDRDHNITLKGSLDTNGHLFQNLCKHYKCEFSEKNGWTTLIKNERGLPFTISMHRNGSVRIWLKKMMGWKVITEYFAMEFSFLSDDQYFDLLECLKHNSDQYFFLQTPKILETANMIAPPQVIKENFEGACIKVKNVFSKGIFDDVTVKVDWSKRAPELERQGREDPTRLLGDIIKGPTELTNAIGIMASDIDTIANQRNYTLEQVKEILNNTNISDEKSDKIIQYLSNSNEEIQSLKVFVKTILQNQQANRFRDIIEDQVQSRNTRYKRKLGLVLQTIFLFPGSRIELLEKESGIPKKSLYGYLKTLSDVKIIQPAKITPNFSKKGRRVLKYYQI